MSKPSIFSLSLFPTLSILLSLSFEISRLIPCFVFCDYGIISYSTENVCHLKCGGTQSPADFTFFSTFDQRSLVSSKKENYFHIKLPWAFKEKKYNPNLQTVQSSPNVITVEAALSNDASLKSNYGQLKIYSNNQVILNDFEFIALNRLTKNYLSKYKKGQISFDPSISQMPSDFYALKFKLLRTFNFNSKEDALHSYYYKAFPIKGSYRVKYSLLVATTEEIEYNFSITSDRNCMGSETDNNLGENNFPTGKTNFLDFNDSDKLPKGFGFSSEQFRNSVVCSSKYECTGELDLEANGRACVAMKNSKWFNSNEVYMTLQFVPVFGIENRELNELYWKETSWFPWRYLFIGLALLMAISCLALLTNSK